MDLAVRHDSPVDELVFVQHVRNPHRRHWPSTALDQSPRFSRRSGLLEPTSVPPRALDMPMNCSSGISNVVNFFFCLLTWLTFLLDGRILFHCTCILMILTFTASSTCLFTWDLSCPGECFLCVVILTIWAASPPLGSRWLDTCSELVHWIQS